MKPATLGILAVLTVIVIGGAWYANNSRTEGAAGVALPDKLFPNLLSHVNDISSVEIVKGKETVHLTKKDNVWTLDNRGGYPVDFEKVKQTVMAVANLKVLEAKTRNPEQYEKLELQDPKEGAPSARMTLKNDAGAVVAALVIGKTNWSGKPSVFVRSADDPQSYQCQGEIKLEESPTSWIKKDVLKVDRERVRSVEIAHADGEVVKITKKAIDDADFAVLDVPPTRELTSASVASPIGTALTWIAIDDLAVPSDIGFEALPATTATYHTFDGLVVELKLADKDGKSYSTMKASWEEPPPRPAPAESQPASPALAKLKTPEAVKQEIEDFNKAHAKWAYVLPSYKSTSITKRMSDLLVALPAADAAESAPATPNDAAPHGDPPHKD